MTLNRPERLNAMSIDLVIELHDALEAVGDDNDCYVVVLTGAGRAFCSGLDLKDYGIIPNIDGLQVGRIAQRSMRYYSRLIPLMRRMPQPVIAAVNGPSYGGGMCLTLGAELRFACRVGHVQRHRHRQRAHEHRARRELAPPPPHRRRAQQRHAAHRPHDRRRRGAAHGPGVAGRCPTTSSCPRRSRSPRAMCEFSPYGLAMTKDIVWVNLENPSLEAAIEIEDRNQLMLGFTDNLPEAIRAFDQGREPVYTDEPRTRPVHAQPAPTLGHEVARDLKV